MNGQQIEDGMYEYQPLERWEVVMLLVRHLRGEDGMSKERAKEVIAENTQMIPSMTGGKLPADEIMIKEVEGVQLNCRFIGGWVDLSSFPSAKRKKLFSMLDDAKENMHPGAWYVLLSWKNWIRKRFRIGFVAVIMTTSVSSWATPAVATVTAK